MRTLWIDFITQAHSLYFYRTNGLWFRSNKSKSLIYQARKYIFTSTCKHEGYVWLGIIKLDLVFQNPSRVYFGILETGFQKSNTSYLQRPINPTQTIFSPSHSSQWPLMQIDSFYSHCSFIYHFHIFFSHFYNFQQNTLIIILQWTMK